MEASAPRRRPGASAPAVAARPRYRWVVLVAAAATQVAFSALQTGLPALGPALRNEFGLSLPALGAVLGATTLGTVATVYAWGVLADRLGERWVLLGGLLGAAGALAAAAAAGPRERSPRRCCSPGRSAAAPPRRAPGR
jgi:MFS family permease